MAARTMNVAMIEFLSRCIPNVGDFDIKDQGNAGHRVVSVEGDFVAFHRDHRDELNAFGRLGLKLHARLDVVDALKRTARNGLNHAVIPLAITVGRFDRHFKLFAFAQPCQRVLEARYDVAVAVNVSKGLLIF